MKKLIRKTIQTIFKIALILGIIYLIGLIITFLEKHFIIGIILFIISLILFIREIKNTY